MTAGFMTAGPRVNTSEGLDIRMVVQYYARWSFIHELLPALRKAKEAKVMSVYSAGRGGKIDTNDLGLKNATRFATAFVGATYNDLMCEVRRFQYKNHEF